MIDARAHSRPDVLKEAASAIFAGGTIVLPTDAGYAIACDALRPEAIEGLRAALGGQGGRGLTMLIASTQEFLEYARDNKLAMLFAKRCLPGPLVMLIRKPDFLSNVLTAGSKTLAVRVPADELAQAVLDRCGPLAAATAYRKDGRRYDGGPASDLAAPAHLVLECGPARYDGETTVVDITGTRPRLLREGAISSTQLTNLLGPLERPSVPAVKEPFNGDSPL